MRDFSLVKGSEFLRKVRRLAAREGAVFGFEGALGKGSHGRLYFGDNSTTLKDLKKEIGPGLLSDMCKQLGIDPRQL